MTCSERGQGHLPTGVRVLVVDDDDDVVRLLASHLARLGCEVVKARTGEQGLSQALADPPDVAIIDVRLPGLSGPGLVQALRAKQTGPRCRIVMTSVIDREDLADLHAALEIDAVLPKPFTRGDLARTLTMAGVGAP